MKKTISKRTAKLMINQDMTIANVAIIKAKMEDALRSAASLNLTLKNIEVIDLTAIQLIYALKKEAESYSKQLKISFDLNADVLKMIRVTGFGDLLEN